MGQLGELAFNFGVGGRFHIVAIIVPLLADSDKAVSPENGRAQQAGDSERRRSSSATAGGMRTTAYRRRRNPSLPTMARFEMGEVLLTTTMSQVFLRLGESVLPGNPTFRERDTKGIVIQIGHASALAERQPARGIKAAGQFDLHVPFAFARPEGQGRKGLLVKIQGHAHKIRLSTAILTGISAIATSEDLNEGNEGGPILRCLCLLLFTPLFSIAESAFSSPVRALK
jgi:hypothetical protein